MLEDNHGFIKLYRDLLNWEWYQDTVVRDVFIHCLLKANYEAKKWQGITIERGQFVTSYPKLAQELNFTERKIRTAIKKLKLTGSIAHKCQAKYSIITVLQYDRWQADVRQEVSQVSGRCQADVRQMSATKEYNNIRNKEIKNINITNNNSENEIFKNSNFYGEYKNVFLLESDFKKLQGLTQSTEYVNKLIKELDVAIETQKEKPYKEGFEHAHYERLSAFYTYQKQHPEGKKESTRPVYKTQSQRKAEKLKELERQGILGTVRIL